MRISLLLLVLALSVSLVSAFVYPSFADTPYGNVSPTNLAPDQSTTITIGDTIAFHVTSVSVTGPDGTVYSYSCGLLECNGDSSNPVTFNFGTGISGWVITTVAPGNGCPGFTPVLGGGANTHCSGEYTVSASGVALSTTPRFSVSTGFSVPEFGLSAVMISAIAFFLLSLRYLASNRGRKTLL